MKNLKVLIPLFVTLALLSFVGQSQATLVDLLTTIELETPVHFLAPDGSDLLVEPGTYSVEPAEEWIRLMSGERRDAILIEAKKGTHEMDLEDALAMSLPGEAEKEVDLHHVMLLLPGGESLEATGTYSGIRPRGFFGKTFNNVKKRTNRAYKKARSTAKKTVSKANTTARKTTKQVQKQTQQAASQAKSAAQRAARQARQSAQQEMSQAKQGVQNARKQIQKSGKQTMAQVRRGARSTRNAALQAKRQVEKTSRRLASKGRRAIPKVRSLTTREKNLARSVFRNTINYDMVRITNTLGAGGRPWTTNTPPLYTINVGSDYPNMMTSNDRKRLLIHELAHVWQGQHLVPFMLNSGAHQALSAINNGGDTAPAYSYKVGKPWRMYNVEQQASIVAHWFMPANLCFDNGPCGGGMKTTDSRYRYIRDHIRKNKAN